MRKSQSTMLKLSEKRQALGVALEKANKDGVTPEEKTAALNEVEAGTTEIRQLEIEYRAHVVTEDAEDRSGEGDMELQEERRLLATASIVPFLHEAVSGRPCSGAEHEIRAAILGDEARPNIVPIDMLEVRQRPGIEQRADAVTPVAAAALADGSQAGILPRVFTRSIAARLLVSMPSVPVGSANYPVMLTGTTAGMRAPDAVIDAGAASFTGFTLDPVRLTARYLFRIEDTVKLRGYEDALRMDLSAVMSDAMDNEMVNGDGTAPSVNGFLHELGSADSPTGVSTAVQMYELFAGLVDGLNAYGWGDLRAIIGGKLFTYMSSTFRANQSENTVYDYLAQRMAGISVSSRIPAMIGTSGADAKTQHAIAALTSYPGRNAVAPIWRGVELIRDPYTEAAKGRVALTAVMLWNFKILRETGWKLLPIRYEA